MSGGKRGRAVTLEPGRRSPAHALLGQSIQIGGGASSQARVRDRVLNPVRGTYSRIKILSATAEKNSRDQTLTVERSGRNRSTSDRAAATSSPDILFVSIRRKACSSSAAASLECPL